MSQVAALIFLILTLPCLFLICYNDLKYMRIQNRLNLYLAFVFILIAPLLIPFDVYLARLLYGAVALVIAFLLIMGSVIGGGDAKMLAAIAPYIALPDWIGFLLVMAVFGLATIVGQWIMRQIPAFRAETREWASWQNKAKVPYGLAISGTFALYLLQQSAILS